MGFFVKLFTVIFKWGSHGLFSKSSTEDLGIFTSFYIPSPKHFSKSSIEDFKKLGDSI